MKLSRRCSFALSTTVSMVLVSLSLLAVPSLRAQQNDSGRVGVPQDWSHRHVIYRGTTSPEVAARTQNDPRIIHNWLARTHAHSDVLEPKGPRIHDRRGKKNTADGFHVDWSASLGTGNLNTGMFPAKYSFNVNATPDCTNDFVVFTVNVAGSPTQANIVGFNNLYTGTTSGLCGGGPSYTGATTTSGSFGTTGTIKYNSLSNSCATLATTTDPGSCDTTVTTAGTYNNFTASFGTNLPASTTITATVMRNGIATSITCSFTTGKSCSDTTHTESFAVNDVIAVQIARSGAGAGGWTTTTQSSLDATPNAYWAYNINSKAILTSPVLSLDGTKVAWADNANPPAFHVLAWQASQGTVGAPDAGSLVTTAPVAGTGQFTTLTYGANGDINSSVYVDYLNDKGYVGDGTGAQQGHLVRIKNVFCTTATCQSTPVEPSLDTTWNATGSVTVGGAGCGPLSAPVVDPVTGDVFVVCTGEGKLYAFNSSGTALTNSGYQFAKGGGLNASRDPDPPIVDSSAATVYVFTGAANNVAGVTGNAAAVFAIPFTSSALTTASAVAATVGKTNIANLHIGAFNDAFWSNSDKSTWLLYVCSTDSTGKFATLYGVTFNTSTGAMNSGTPTNAYSNASFSSAVEECSPVTEFPYNGTDRLFVSLLTTAKIFEFNIGTTGGSAPNPDTSTFPASASAPNASAAETGGTSGIVVDNVSTSGQAHSIYFSSLGGNTAVKLTQDALQ